MASFMPSKNARVMCIVSLFSRLGLPFRTSHFIVIQSPSAYKFSADIFVLNPFGSHVNPRSVKWIFRCIFLCSDSGDRGHPSASKVCRFPRNLWERIAVLAEVDFCSFVVQWITSVFVYFLGRRAGCGTPTTRFSRLPNMLMISS